MNGVDLARWCAAERPGIAIVVTTGYAENLQEFSPTVLRKPYETGALFAALEKAGKRRAAA
ncbi:MAG: hypothetical protein QM777_24000 [Pseudorhodoferax sp.]